tara:strand:+ start:1171 stop:1587 length:417 start_codon:yes stop_codon:yes gene_type:complete
MFFNNKKMTENNNSYMVKIAALLIHVAKIDEKYSDKEEEIIKKTLIDLEVNQNEIENLMSQAKIIEENANQILDFTKEVKNLEEENKIKIVKSLWKIVYSDKEADMYETNLMRRLAGLLYIDSKTMGDIKDQIKKENS